MISKFAKKGMTPSAIGVLLRDSHGIPHVKTVTGSKILRILKGQGLAPDLPEDLYHLIKKAVAMRKHLDVRRSTWICLDFLYSTCWWQVEMAVPTAQNLAWGSHRASQAG